MTATRFEYSVDPVRMADQLTRGLKNKALRISMNKAASPVKASVVSKAPVRYGFLSKSVRIKVKSYKGGSVWVAVVGPKSDFVKNRGKDGKGNPIRHRPGKYARLVEKGTKYATAHPFLLPALAATRTVYLTTLTASIKEQVAAMLPKI